MEINAKMVNALRARTGAGMMDCKRALVEANGDEEQAVEILRKKGAAIADKKAEAGEQYSAKDSRIDGIFKPIQSIIMEVTYHGNQ